MNRFNEQKDHNSMITSFLSLFQTTLLVTFIFILFSTEVYSQRYEMVWSDEFEEQQLDDETWNPWEGTAYNNEHQYYTPREDNIYQEDGFLYLVGLRENYGGRQWTSGRINTQDNFEFQYGKVEIRAKLPEGKGLWPAFWMLGSNIDDIGWPYSGEIDIMEYRGHLHSQTSGTIHFSAVEPSFPQSPNSDRRLIGEEYDLPAGSFTDDFHLFQFQWSDSLMIWSIDDVEFYRLTREEIEERTSFYPFDQPFYLILNLAIGGDFLGDQQPDGTTPDRNEVIVDYVRVYQDVNKEPNIETGYGTEERIEPNQNLTLKANVTDEDGNIDRVEFHLNDENIATVTSPPYQVDWRPGIDGCYELLIKAYDNENGVGRNNPRTNFVVGTGCTKRSFLDTPQTFPGTLQFELYDYGGLGTSYYDSSPDTNLGNGQGNDFRTTEAVDIISDDHEEGNYLITNTVSGEWLSYQLEVEQSGIYDIELRFVPGNQSGRLNFSLDDEEWIYFTRLDSRDDEYYSTKKTTVELHEGTYELKVDIAIDGGGIKPDYLKAILKETITSNENNESFLPSSIELQQNYPNPFNPTTVISVQLDQSQNTTLEVFNSLGQHIETLQSGQLSTGKHSFTFDASGLSSGIYYYQLSATNSILARKMLLLK